MAPVSPSVVVFSEMDGVLRNPHGPAFGRAASTLKALAREDTAVVLCSGKTRAELQFVQQKLDICQPFICENGGAVVIPSDYFSVDVPGSRVLAGYRVVEFGRPYTDVVDLLHRTAERLRIRVVGFSDMSIDEVAQECRLPLLQARLAKLREYEEPFQVAEASGNARPRLFKALQAASLRCASGSLFDRVGAPIESNAGVNLLNGLFRRSAASVMTVGLAHTVPDDSLLRLVDYPVVFPDDEAAGEALDVVDWAEAIVDLVDEVRRRPGPASAEAAGSRFPSTLLH